MDKVLLLLGTRDTGWSAHPRFVEPILRDRGAGRAVLAGFALQFLDLGVRHHPA